MFFCCILYFMESVFLKKCLIVFYFACQCVYIIVAFNVWLWLFFVIFVSFTLSFTPEWLGDFVFLFLYVAILLLYFLLVIIATLSTVKIFINKPLNKFEKFSSVLYPIIAPGFLLYCIVEHKYVITNLLFEYGLRSTPF